MSWPDFLFLGAPRSGTTLLYEGLRQHPELWLSQVKEPLYFLDPRYDVHRVGHPSTYRALFADRLPHQRAGEVSTLYLYDPTAPERIHRSLPEARLVAILRDPIDRAYSQYTFQRLLGQEPYPTFEEAVRAESGRRNPFLCYQAVSRYAQQVARYQEIFPPSQLLFVLNDDLRRDPAAVFRQIFSFLEVDPDFAPDLGDGRNASGVPRHDRLYRWAHRAARPFKSLLPPRWLSSLQGRANQALLRPAPALPSATRAHLLEEAGFAMDIAETSRLLERDLTPWLS